MGIIENAKEIADLVKKAGDIDLYRKIVELEGEVIELTREKRALEEKVAEQDKALQLQKALKFSSEGFYWIEGEQVPYCPRCWEVQRRVVHLFHAFTNEDKTRYDCPDCKQMFLTGPIRRSHY
jgi:vacuolar-type H+-ATPase subunit I/STV1